MESGVSQLFRGFAHVLLRLRSEGDDYMFIKETYRDSSSGLTGSGWNQATFVAQWMLFVSEKNVIFALVSSVFTPHAQ